MTIDRPLLAVIHGDGSVSPMKLAESATTVCDLLWVIDSTGLKDRLLPRLLRKLGLTIDVAGMSEDEAVDALRHAKPDGIVTYADQHIPLASALAGRLGLEYHDAVTAGRLVDKLMQRRALGEGGLPVPRCVEVPRNATQCQVEAAVAHVEFPVVLKPRRGTGSTDTLLAHGAMELWSLIANLGPPSSEPNLAMLVEEYMTGAVPPPSSRFADYVSVESVVSGGQVSHVAVNGRFPPAEPFRESGFFIPSDFSAAQIDELLALATRAISVLGIKVGFLHTEIKVTPKGPRVIEVNGRLGGSVPEMLALAAPGVNLFELSQRVALGKRVFIDGLVPTQAVGYLLTPHAPQWARRVVAVENLDRLGEYPGVKTIFLNRKPGDAVDWRKGSHEYVFSVMGAAPDHEGVLAVQRFIDEHVKVTYA